MVQANPHSRIHGGHLAMDIPFLARIPYIGLDLEIIHEPPMSVQHKRRTWGTLNIFCMGGWKF